MKKTYMLPELEIVIASEIDTFSLSFIIDETNRENVVKDPFAPMSTQITMDR